MKQTLRLALALLSSACISTGPSEPRLIGEGMPMLFIGNSLTYVNDVPGILQALADSAGGARLAVQTHANPNYAVIDHWNDGDARRVIESRQWGYVVLQQGWTPAGVCRDTLRLATTRFAPLIEKAGAKTALYQAWAPENRPGQFQGTIESYRLAASDVGGVLFPVAEAWLAAQRRSPGISLYADGLHANQAGSYLAALVMYARVMNKTPVGLPSRLRTRIGIVIDLDAQLARVLQDAAAEVGLAPTPVEEPVAQPVITSAC